MKGKTSWGTYYYDFHNEVTRNKVEKYKKGF